MIYRTKEMVYKNVYRRTDAVAAGGMVGDMRGRLVAAYVGGLFVATGDTAGARREKNIATGDVTKR